MNHNPNNPLCGCAACQAAAIHDQPGQATRGRAYTKNRPPEPDPVPGMDGGALMYGDYRQGLPEIIEDREAIRAELKASRKRHTVRVRQHVLP